MSETYRQKAIEFVRQLATNRAFSLSQRIAISQGFWVELGEHPAHPGVGSGYPFKFIQDETFWNVGVQAANIFCETYGL